MELISVIVPVYGVEEYLYRCVDSIRGQTYGNLDIILVDDGSPDRCPELCEELARQDPRIRVVHKENGGQGLARNSGLEIARGEYVTFVDADDWISAEHIQRLHRRAAETGADMVLGGHTVADNSLTCRAYPPVIEERVYEGEQVIEQILLPMIAPEPEYPEDVMIQSSACMGLYRMDLIRQHGLQFVSERVTVAEDLHFNIDFLSHARRVAVLKEAGYFYFENNASSTRKYNPLRTGRTIHFYTAIRDRMRAHGLEERCGYRLDRCYLMKVRVAIRLIVISDLPRREKLSQIRTLLSAQTTRSALAEYPIQVQIPAMRLLLQLMRRESAWGVYGLMKLREGARNQQMLKALLKKLGIGKNN